MWLTRLALKYPISTFLFAVTILVPGLVSLSQLPIDLPGIHHRHDHAKYPDEQV